MANNNDALLIQIISVLQGITGGGSGGTGGNVTVDNQITGFNLEATQQALLTELQALLLSSDYSSSNFVDYSSTITTLNASQQIAPLNVNRRYLLIQNISDTDMFINFGAAATTGTGSIKLVPNGNYELSSVTGGYINTQAINIICSIAGKEFTAKEA